MRTRDALLVEVALTRGTARCLSLLAVEVIGLMVSPHTVGPARASAASVSAAVTRSLNLFVFIVQLSLKINDTPIARDASRDTILGAAEDTSELQLHRLRRRGHVV